MPTAPARRVLFVAAALLALAACSNPTAPNAITRADNSSGVITGSSTDNTSGGVITGSSTDNTSGGVITGSSTH